MTMTRAAALSALLLVATAALAAPGAFTLDPPATVCDPTSTPAVALTWSASAGATSYTVYRFGFQYAAGITGTTYTDTTVSTGAAYEYFVRATDGAATTDSNSQTAYVQSCPIPGDFTVTAGPAFCQDGSNAITLTWTAASYATEYLVYRDDAQNVSPSLPPSTHSFTVPKLLYGAHTFYVFAKNRQGMSVSNIAGGDANASCTPPLEVYLSATVACGGPSPAVQLSWTGGAASSWQLFRDSSPIGTFSGGTTDFTDTAVQNGQTYNYFIRATNPNGSRDSDNVQAKINCPVQGPPVLSASTSCDASGTAPLVHLSWTVPAGATMLQLYRDGVSYGPTIFDGRNSYDDVGVHDGETHTYVLHTNTTPDSNAVTIQAATCSSVPSGPLLSATTACDSGTSRVHLSWTAAGGATGYQVYKNGSPYGSPFDSSRLFFDDGIVTQGATNSYFVRASTSVGSSDSNAVSIAAAVCPAQPASPVLTGSVFCTGAASPAIRLTWNAIAGVSSYTIFRQNVSIGTVSATTFDDTTVPPGGSYHYYVHAQNSTGSADSNTIDISISTLQCPATPPDFALMNVQSSKMAVMPGDTVTVSATLSNVGTGSSPASAATVHIGSGETMSLDDPLIATIPLAPLAAGASTTIGQPVTIPSIPAGTYSLFVIADEPHSSGDPNVANNIGRSAALTVGGTSVCTVSCAARVQGNLTALQSVFFSLAQAPSCAATIRWQFGDGDTSSAAAPSHAYQHPGTFHWTVTVTAGTSSCESSGTVTIAPVPSRRRAATH